MTICQVSFMTFLVSLSQIYFTITISISKKPTVPTLRNFKSSSVPPPPPSTVGERLTVSEEEEHREEEEGALAGAGRQGTASLPAREGTPPPPTPPSQCLFSGSSPSLEGGTANYPLSNLLPRNWARPHLAPTVCQSGGESQHITISMCISHQHQDTRSDELVNNWG